MTGLIKLAIILLSILLFGKHFLLLGGLFTLTLKTFKNIYSAE